MLRITIPGDSPLAGEYSIDPDKVTLGQARILKRDYNLEGLGKINLGDPDQAVGFVALAIMEKHPEAKKTDVDAAIEAIEFVTFADGIEADEPKESVDPTNAAAGGAAKPHPNRATRRKASGRPR